MTISTSQRDHFPPGVNDISEQENVDRGSSQPGGELAPPAGLADPPSTMAAARPHSLQLAYQPRNRNHKVPTRIQAILQADDEIKKDLLALGFAEGATMRYLELPAFYQQAVQLINAALSEHFKPGQKPIEVIGADVMEADENVDRDLFDLSRSVIGENKEYILVNSAAILDHLGMCAGIAHTMQILTYEVSTRAGHDPSRTELIAGTSENFQAMSDSVSHRAGYDNYLNAIRNLLPFLQVSEFPGLEGAILAENPSFFASPRGQFDFMLRSRYLEECVSDMRVRIAADTFGFDENAVGQAITAYDELISGLVRPLEQTGNNPCLAIWRSRANPKPVRASLQRGEKSRITQREGLSAIENQPYEIFSLVAHEVKAVDKSGPCAMALSSKRMREFMHSTGILTAEQVSDELFDLSHPETGSISGLNNLLTDVLKRKRALWSAQRLQTVELACSLNQTPHNATIELITSLVEDLGHKDRGHGVWYACELVPFASDPTQQFERLATIVMKLGTDKEKAAGLRLLSKLGDLPVSERTARFDQLMELVTTLKDEKMLASALWFVAEALIHLPVDAIPKRLALNSRLTISQPDETLRTTSACHLVDLIIPARQSICRPTFMSLKPVANSISDKTAKRRLVDKMSTRIFMLRMSEQAEAEDALRDILNANSAQ